MKREDWEVHSAGSLNSNVVKPGVACFHLLLFMKKNQRFQVGFFLLIANSIPARYSFKSGLHTYMGSQF